MWVTLTANGVSTDYSYAAEGVQWGILWGMPGGIENDMSRYYASVAVSFDLDKAQFEAASDFAITCQQEGAFGDYAVFTHSCVDFAWSVAKQAGIPVMATGGLWESDGWLRPVNNEDMMYSVREAYVASGNAYNLATSDDKDILGVINGYPFGSEVVRGSSVNNSLDGGIGDDHMWGFAGDDFLDGGLGSDWLFGGKGNDILSGGPGSDMYAHATGDGNDTIYTGGGRDQLVLGGPATFGRNGVDVLVVTSRAETIRVKDWFTAGTTDNMLDAVVASDHTYSRNVITNELLHVEGSNDASVGDNIAGVAGYSDSINGNAGDDYIDVSQACDIKASDEVHGGSGNDTIYAGDSNDFLYGDAGNDFINGGAGVDVIKGGDGNDTLVTTGDYSELDGDSGVDTLMDRGSNNALRGGDGNDSVYLFGSGSTGDGGNGDDLVQTFGDRDVAMGGKGTDLLRSYGTRSTLIRGEGNDTIDDQLGSAIIVWAPGDGADTVVQAGMNTAVQFAPSSAAYTVTAHLDSNYGLVLQASTGGSVTIAYWGYGANQVNVQAPEGSIWTSADIAAQFRPPTYSITYDHLPVVHAEDAFNLFMSYCRPLTDFYVPGDNRWNDDTRADNLAMMASQTGGGAFRPDASGTWYLSTSNNFTYQGTTTNVWFQTDHGTFQGSYWITGSVDMSWDRWVDDSGQTWVALTHVNNSVVIEGDWMEPPTLDTPYWTQHGQVYNYYPVTGSSTRTVTLADPGIDYVVLGNNATPSGSLASPASAPDMAFAATSAELRSSAAVGDTRDISQLLSKLFDADTLATWDAQAWQANAQLGPPIDAGLDFSGQHPTIELVGVTAPAHEGALMLA